jgi:hypothetical protein
MPQQPLSPDGRYRWDGRQWIPHEVVAPPRRRRRWPWVLAVSALLFVGVCSIAANSAPSKGGTVTSTGTTASTPVPRDGSCSPQPCANDGYGWIVTASRLKFDAWSGSDFVRPEAGNVFVTVDVTFTNKLSRERHANPFEFVLQDGAGVKHKVTSTPSCPLWDAVNLTQNATFGPRCLAFQAADKPGGLTLVWTPSFGGGDYNIRL